MLAIGPCRAEEVFQEFIEYLSHGQTLDRMSRTRSSREFLQLKRSKKNKKKILHSCQLTSQIQCPFWHRRRFTRRMWPAMKEARRAVRFFPFLFVFAHECCNYLQIRFTDPPLKTVMSSFSCARHGPRGALSSQGVIFKMPFNRKTIGRMQLRAPEVERENPFVQGPLSSLQQGGHCGCEKLVK